ncbi:MAG: endonuclease domain-containing protein [Candidatus Saccharimonadales bacterium]
MKPKYQQFIFEDYHFDVSSKTLSLDYSFDETLYFHEAYNFNFDFASYNQVALDRVCQSLFLMAGVSYYKAYLAPKIVIKKGQFDDQMVNFFSKTYERGLGEFFFVNKLDPHTPVVFPATTNKLEPLPVMTQALKGMLIGIGGGKDSLVSVNLLQKSADNLATWSVGHRQQVEPMIKRIGLPHYWVDRSLDSSLFELNSQDALNGHIPISAILAFVGVVVAVLSGHRDVVVSNEQSANEPTLKYQGVAINHQYSKSSEFEQDFQTYLEHLLGQSVRYYSLLRPLSELRIAELFAFHGFDTYHNVFSSCNRAFTQDSDHLFWDGICPKCAFIFLALTPFIKQQELEALFDGQNLLKKAELEPTYRQLLGIEDDKPLECVGEIKESRAAMKLAARVYPELADKYHFELPVDYDYKALGPHHMPEEVYRQFNQSLSAW